jgi:sec-independent protein translocase protein TatB
VLGINGYEFVLLAVIAVVILGPERLPQYAAQLARLVKELRRMATGAREQLREEVGPEIDEVDWRKLDPRQYDPRRIIREALVEDFSDAVAPLKDTSQKPAPARATGAPGAASQTPALAAQTTPPQARLADGQQAPFDADAT